MGTALALVSGNTIGNLVVDPLEPMIPPVETISAESLREMTRCLAQRRCPTDEDGNWIICCPLEVAEDKAMNIQPKKVAGYGTMGIRTLSVR